MLVERATRELVSAGVDYITATTTTRTGKRAFERIGFWELKKEEARGNEPTTYHAHGGEGIRCGSAEFMSHPDYYMIRFSSHIAAERWKDVVKDSTNVSRLDLQATVRFTPHQNNLAEIVERHMLRYKRERNRTLELELRRNDVKGKTLYSGSKKSDLFSRLYDKGRESKLEAYAGCWRLENQFNNRPAKQHAAQLLRHPDPEAGIVQQVATYYAKRGAVVLNSRLGVYPYSSGGKYSEFTPNSSGGYQWLEKQVRPFVKREADRGNLGRILEALGITPELLKTITDADTKE